MASALLMAVESRVLISLFFVRSTGIQQFVAASRSTHSVLCLGGSGSQGSASRKAVATASAYAFG